MMAKVTDIQITNQSKRLRHTAGQADVVSQSG